VICGTRIFSFKKSYSLPREETGEKHKDNSLRKGAKNGDANEVTARIKAKEGGGWILTCK
jgi:hypothetical protein